jgi:hypothetical protein
MIVFHYLVVAVEVIAAVIFLIVAFAIAASRAGSQGTRSTGLPGNKKYRMRGYGGDPSKYTSLHPRQAAQGKRIVFIPGVGYRHVKATGKKK